MAKRKVYGKCRVCGKEKQLTQEHYIPRAAGGGMKIKLYSGDELMKSFQKDENGNPFKLRGKIKQNDLSGLYYDKEFAKFNNGIHYVVGSQVKIPSDQSTDDYLEHKVASLHLPDIKPVNIAKRILVSFCSLEHPGLTDRQPEIRKAILDKSYQPNTTSFAIYMSLHLGNSAYYGTVAALKNINGEFFTQAYAGIENELIAFYLTSHKDTIARGIDKCTDITPWLNRYEYDQEVKMDLELAFNKSLMVRFPTGNDT